MNDLKLYGLNLFGYALIVLGIIIIFTANLTGSTLISVIGVIVILIGLYVRFKYKRRSGIIIHRG